MLASVLRTARRQIGRCRRQVGSILAADEYYKIIHHARCKASDWLKPPGVIWPVFPDNVLAAGLATPFAAPVPRVAQGRAITVNWVTGAAGPGSGGHTTMYRIILRPSAERWEHSLR